MCVCVYVCTRTWSSIWPCWLHLHWASHLHTQTHIVRTLQYTHATYCLTFALFIRSQTHNWLHTRKTTWTSHTDVYLNAFVYQTCTYVRTTRSHVLGDTQSIGTYKHVHTRTHPREGCFVVKLFHSLFSTLSLTKCHKSTPYNNRRAQTEEQCLNIGSMQHEVPRATLLHATNYSHQASPAS